MQITVNANDLRSVVSKLSSVVEKRFQLITGHILFDAVGESLTLYGTNMEISYWSHCPANIKEPGKIMVPGKKLYDIIKKLPNKPIKISVKDENTVIIACSRSKFKIYSIEVSQFPEIDFSIKDVVFSKIKAGVLTSMLKQVSMCMGKDQSRIAMCGVNLKTAPGELIVTATNSQILGRTKRQVSLSGFTYNGLIHRDAVTALIKVLDDDDEDVSIGCTKRDLIIMGKNYGIFACEIKASFPAIDAAFDHTMDFKYHIKRENIITAIERVAVILDKGQTIQITFSPNKKAYYVTADNIMTTDRARALFEIEDECVEPASEFNVGCSINYMRDVLRSITADKVCFSFQKGQYSAIFLEGIDDLYCRYIIAPRVGNG